MEIQEIHKFITEKMPPGSEQVKITFRKRDPVYGLFLKENRDYDELKSKNFWRIVLKSNFENYKKTKVQGLARIFSGKEFSKITPYVESVV